MENTTLLVRSVGYSIRCFAHHAFEVQGMCWQDFRAERARAVALRHESYLEFQFYTLSHTPRGLRMMILCRCLGLQQIGRDIQRAHEAIESMQACSKSRI